MYKYVGDVHCKSTKISTFLRNSICIVWLFLFCTLSHFFVFGTTFSSLEMCGGVQLDGKK